MSKPANKMTYVSLGKSGLKVSRIILGTMSYGSPEWQGWVLGEEEGLEHIKAAYDMGINTFDTANVYSNGRSEEILGKAIKKYNLPREEIVVLTKVWFAVDEKTPNLIFYSTDAEYDAAGFANRRGLSRKHIFDSIKASLRRLQLDYVDVLQCHRFDPNTPIEETMQALHDVVQAGYARYIGMSSCYAWQFHKMQNYAINNKLTPFISMQNYHNAVYREEEREMMPLLKDLGVGCIPWSPLARGFLTRPAAQVGDSVRGKEDSWMRIAGIDDSNIVVSINQKVEEIAKAHGVTMSQVALAWTLSKDFITAPIVGTTKLKNLEELVAGLELKLTEEEIKSIDDLYGPRQVYGHW